METQMYPVYPLLLPIWIMTLGVLIMAQMVGRILGNVLAGYLGDRGGGKLLLVTARAVLVGVCLGAAFNRSEIGFLAVFALLGFAMVFDQIGSATFSMEMCPSPRRPTYLAMVSTIRLPSMLAAAKAPLAEAKTAKTPQR